MEFNITLTAEDYIEAAALSREEFNKKSRRETMVITIKICSGIAFVTPLIFVIVAAMILNIDWLVTTIVGGFIYLIIYLLILISSEIAKTYTKHNMNELVAIGIRKYRITANSIHEETQYYIGETKIQGIVDCLENDRLFCLRGSGSSYIFPKKEIDQVPEKDEFYQWINEIKKQTEKSSKENLSRKRQSLISILRETFLEDSPRHNDGATKDNGEAKR